MSARNVAILLGLAALLGVGLWLSARYQPAMPAPEQEGVAASPSEVQSDALVEKTDVYTIDISYPVVEQQQIQQGIDEVVKEELDRFKTEIVTLIDEQEADRIRAQKTPYELFIEFQTYSHGQFFSVEFDIYLNTGGAHPNTFFRTVTFDGQGTELALEDLFVEGVPYLGRLSDEAYNRVTEELEVRMGGSLTPDMEDGMRIGTAPSPEALQFFYLSNGELHLLFPPYQVAAYAAGSFDIAIPLSDLRDILKPEIL